MDATIKKRLEADLKKLENNPLFTNVCVIESEKLWKAVWVVDKEANFILIHFCENYPFTAPKISVNLNSSETLEITFGQFPFAEEYSIGMTVDNICTEILNSIARESGNQY